MTAEKQALADMTHIESSTPSDGGPGVSEVSPTAMESTSGTVAETAESTAQATEPGKVREIGGRKDGPEPTRFGDWERNGRCVDF